jgi:hypothetical protein
MILDRERNNLEVDTVINGSLGRDAKKIMVMQGRCV